MKYPSILEKLSKELDVPKEVVDAAYKSFFAFIRETITSLPLKEDLEEEDFNKLKTNFNLPAIGKLHCTYERYLGMKEQNKFVKKLREEYEHKKD
jgi:hypothetical protein